MPSILILIETHILVQYAAFSNFPSEYEHEHLSAAVTAIFVALYMNFSGHSDGNPDQCQEGSSTLTALRQSSASGFIWITTVTQGYWCEKTPIFLCKRIFLSTILQIQK